MSRPAALRGLAAPMRLGPVASVSASVGLAPVGPTQLADALYRADAAMYRAKHHSQRRRPTWAHQHVLHTSLRLAKPTHPTSAT